MIGGGQCKLPDAVLAWIGVDPEEHVLVGTETKRDLVLGRFGQCRVDDVNVPGDHRTP